MAQWLCHSVAMIMVSFTWCVLCLSMTIMALRIRKITFKLNVQMLRQIGQGEDTNCEESGAHCANEEEEFVVDHTTVAVAANISNR